MCKKQRVPEVLWKLFQNRARTLAETILLLIPSSSATNQCRCKGSRRCLRCCADADRMSFLLTQNDPSDYRNLLNQCFVVVSDNAPCPPPFDPHSRWPQHEIVRRTIEMILREKTTTKNVICASYSTHNRSSSVLEALTSASWSLLLQRVGDSLMVYLLKYSSIFMPLPRKKHHQVAGVPINDLCWKFLKHNSKSKNQQPSSGFAEKFYEVDSVSKNDDSSKSFVSCLGCNLKGSVTPSMRLRKRKCSMKNFQGDSKEVIDANCSGNTQENAVLAVARLGKRLRPYAWQRRRKRMKLLSENMNDADCSLSKEKTKFPCSCCTILQTIQKVPRETQITRRFMFYKLGRASSILPRKHIINSLRPNVAGATALFQEIFGVSDACIASQPTLCSHSNDVCMIGTTCLYHSLRKLLKILIQKVIRCPRKRLLNKHITTTSSDKNANKGESSSFQRSPLADLQGLCCSKRQVVSFIWAACRSIVPQELLGSSSNCRILRKNISKFIRLRLYEGFSVYHCMHKLRTSNFPFLLDNHSLCYLGASVTKQNLFERWIYWFFTRLVVPLVQANFYVTETEHGKLEVFFYEKSVWEKLIKTSISCLKEQCYSLLDVKAVKKILSARAFGFSRVRLLPKADGIRPLANLKSPSRLLRKDFKAVNVVLRDLHAVLKDVQLKRPDQLGSSVFNYNDVHRKIRHFLSCVKSGLSTFPGVYMVVADVRKAYDSIDQDKLLQVMKDVISENHLLHQTHQVVASKRYIQVCQHINLSRQFSSYVRAHSSHSILINQGRSRTARKEDLHFNLQQHVKYNLLHISKRFYLQNVGIPQGSIVSSLLCSFYYGHMENMKLLPFLNKIPQTGDFKCQDLLLRFIDDFLFISTSKKQACAFLSRLERGFSEYNCNMNTEKFGLSFDGDEVRPKSKRLYVDESGNKFLRWSGLFINCNTFQVQADYTRYLDTHLSSTLTVRWQGKTHHHLREKLCDYLRPKCHAIFYDSKINSAAVVRLNIHQSFLLCAMKFHCYICQLSHTYSFDSRYYMNIIHNSLRFMYKLIKKRMYSFKGDPSLRPILKVKKPEVKLLGLTAYFQVLKRKHSRYKELLSLLEMKLTSLNVERASPALRFAFDKSNSSVLWKIKY